MPAKGSPPPAPPSAPQRRAPISAADKDPIVSLGYARTPRGGFQGSLGEIMATELGAIAVRAAVDRSGVSPEAIEQIVMGCVSSAGLGQATARQDSSPSVMEWIAGIAVPFTADIVGLVSLGERQAPRHRSHDTAVQKMRITPLHRTQ
jgi:hypothetical protein